MATPTAVFPSAIATDGQLKVANNLIQTTLKVGAGSADTILFVNSVAGFVANCLVSIDGEIAAIASVTSGGTPQLNVASGGRGFDGTAAATHNAGAKVSMFIDAWHHNAVSTEIKAIETFLGPNGQNLNTQLTGYVLNTAYQFAPQTPGGVLTATITNVVTLSPVPQGVSGTDTNHYLYISGGVGTAEPVLITGGSAVSGAASGTITFVPAYGHSGAWTIQSATAGIQEACQVSQAIMIPPGNYSVYATITPRTKTYIFGLGKFISTLTFQSATLALFNSIYPMFMLSHISLEMGSSLTGVSGSYAIYVEGTGAGGGKNGAYTVLFEVMIHAAYYNGIRFNNPGQTGCIVDTQVDSTISDGFVGINAFGHWHAVNAINCGGNGYNFSGTIAPDCNGIQSYNCGGWGYRSTAPNMVHNGFFNNDRSGEIYSNVVTEGGFFTDIFIQASGQSTTSPNTTGPGVVLDTSQGPTALTNIRTFNTNGIAFDLRSGGHQLAGINVEGPGYQNVAGNLYALKSVGGTVISTGCRWGGPVLLSGGGNIFCSNIVAGNYAGGPLLEFGTGANGNIFYGNVLNQVGAGQAAYQVDSGAAVIPGFNSVLSGTVINNGGFATDMRQNFPVQALTTGATNAIAAANTIAPVAQVTHVTGVATIKTITPPVANSQLSGTNVITLIADSAWLTDQTGNIGSAAFTATVGIAYTFFWDGAKWYRST